MMRLARMVLPCACRCVSAILPVNGLLFTGRAAIWIFYFEKIRVFKAGYRLNTLAWNNRIGRAVLFCWFLGPP